MSDTIADAIIAELKIELSRRRKALEEASDECTRLRAELAAEKERVAFWIDCYNTDTNLVHQAERLRDSEPGELDVLTVGPESFAVIDKKGNIIKRFMTEEGARIHIEQHSAVAQSVTLPDDLAGHIERELNAWRGANGGIYTIHACALGVAAAVRASNAKGGDDE